MINKPKFRKAIQSKTKLGIKKDLSDLLIYLIYINYVSKLIEGSGENGELSVRKLMETNNALMKQFRG